MGSALNLLMHRLKHEVRGGVGVGRNANLHRPVGTHQRAAQRLPVDQIWRPEYLVSHTRNTGPAHGEIGAADAAGEIRRHG